jgi:hypothetical protein
MTEVKVQKVAHSDKKSNLAVFEEMEQVAERLVTVDVRGVASVGRGLIRPAAYV